MIQTTTAGDGRRKERSVPRWPALALALSWVVFLVGSSGCAAAPPKGWQQGGAELMIPRARWFNGDAVVDVDQDGRVVLNGKHVLNVDRAGRAYDPYDTPVALLGDDGHLVGPDDEPMGWVGAGEAILPGDEEPWIAVLPSGEVVRYTEDGDPVPFGLWVGCNQIPHTLQACTLVSHLVGIHIREMRKRRRGGVSFGVGFGVGVGFGP